MFSLTLPFKDSLSRLFSRCGHVQSVDICDKPGPGEKKDKLASKFFDHKTLKVKLGWRRGILIVQWEKMASTEWFSSEDEAQETIWGIGCMISYLS